MSALTVDLPPTLQHWVDMRLEDGGFSDAGEYLRDLIRRDRDKMDPADTDEDAEMRALVEEGLMSGECDDEPEEVLRRVIAGMPAAHG